MTVSEEDNSFRKRNCNCESISEQLTSILPEEIAAILQSLHPHHSPCIVSESPLQRLLQTEHLVALISTVIETLFKQYTDL